MTSLIPLAYHKYPVMSFDEHKPFPQTRQTRQTRQTPVIKYAAGFMFDPSLKRVVLIRKDRPAAYVDKWCAPGGKIEPFERPADAMRREFREETGVDFEDWKWLGLAVRPGYAGYIYYASSALVIDTKTMTSEPVSPWPVSDIREGLLSSIIPDLRWMLEMALACASGACGPIDCVEHAR